MGVGLATYGFDTHTHVVGKHTFPSLVRDLSGLFTIVVAVPLDLENHATLTGGAVPQTMYSKY